MKHAGAATVLCFLSVFVAAQDRILSSPVTLRITSHVDAGLPGFGAWGTSQCDAKGNLYFHASHAVNDTVILRFNSRGESSIFTLPKADADEVYFLAFRVLRDGRLYTLNRLRSEKGARVYEFSKSDETVKHATELEVPEGFDVRNFAVTGSAEFLVEGYFTEVAGSDVRGFDKTLHFDENGRLVGGVAEKVDANVVKDAARVGTNAAAAMDEAGNIFLLGPSAISVLSPTGKKLRSLPIESPDTGYKPSNLYFAEGQIVLAFSKAVPRIPTMKLYATYDPLTGVRRGLYKAPDEAGNHEVCYSSEGLVFMKYEAGRVNLITAKP